MCAAPALGQLLIYHGRHYTQKICSTANQDAGNLFPGDVNQVTFSHPKSTSPEIRLQNEDRVLDMFDHVVGYFDDKNGAPAELSVSLPVPQRSWSRSQT